MIHMQTGGGDRGADVGSILDLQSLFDFERNGHVAVRGLLSPEEAKGAHEAL